MELYQIVTVNNREAIITEIQRFAQSTFALIEFPAPPNIKMSNNQYVWRNINGQLILIEKSLTDLVPLSSLK